MSTSASASSIAIQAGMTILPIHSNSTSKARNSDCLPGWPQSSDMAQRAMEVLGKSLCCLQITALTSSKDMQLGTKAIVCMAVTGGFISDLHAGLDASEMVQPTESHFVAGSNASNEDDATDLLMLHIAQPAESIQAQLELSDSPPFSDPNLGDVDGGHDQASLLPAAPPSTTCQSSFGGASCSAAAAYSWLNDLVSCLWRMPAFHQSVLMVLLLTNSHTSDLQRFQVPLCIISGSSAPVIKQFGADMFQDADKSTLGVVVSMNCCLLGRGRLCVPRQCIGMFVCLQYPS